VEHENCIGESDDWYTPPFIFDALGCRFDLDPCSPGASHWVPADRVFTKSDDGLSQDWGQSFVWMNPPFGGRESHVPWLEKFLSHANGIGLCRAYTSAGWFHDVAIKAESLLFPRGKTKFIRPDGSVGKAPGGGVVLLGMGSKANDALRKSKLGWFVKNKQR